MKLFLLLLQIALTSCQIIIYEWKGADDGSFHDFSKWNHNEDGNPTELNPNAHYVFPDFIDSPCTITFSDNRFLIKQLTLNSPNVHLIEEQSMSIDTFIWNAGSLTSLNRMSCSEMIMSSSQSKTLTTHSALFFPPNAKLTINTPNSLRLEQNSWIEFGSGVTIQVSGSSTATFTGFSSSRIINYGTFTVSSNAKLIMPSLFTNYKNFILQSGSSVSLGGFVSMGTAQIDGDLTISDGNLKLVHQPPVENFHSDLVVHYDLRTPPIVETDVPDLSLNGRFGTTNAQWGSDGGVGHLDFTASGTQRYLKINNGYFTRSDLRPSTIFAEVSFPSSGKGFGYNIGSRSNYRLYTEGSKSLTYQYGGYTRSADIVWNTWYYVTMTVSSARNVWYYLDDVNFFNTVLTVRFDDLDHPPQWDLGAVVNSDGSTSVEFGGRLRQFRMYSTQLSGSDVASLRTGVGSSEDIDCVLTGGGKIEIVNGDVEFGKDTEVDLVGPVKVTNGKVKLKSDCTIKKFNFELIDCDVTVENDVSFDVIASKSMLTLVSSTVSPYSLSITSFHTISITDSVLTLSTGSVSTIDLDVDSGTLEVLSTLSVTSKLTVFNSFIYFGNTISVAGNFYCNSCSVAASLVLLATDFICENDCTFSQQIRFEGLVSVWVSQGFLEFTKGVNSPSSGSSAFVLSNQGVLSLSHSTFKPRLSIDMTDNTCSLVISTSITSNAQSNVMGDGDVIIKNGAHLTLSDIKFFYASSLNIQDTSGVSLSGVSFNVHTVSADLTAQQSSPSEFTFTGGFSNSIWTSVGGSFEFSLSSPILNQMTFQSSSFTLEVGDWTLKQLTLIDSMRYGSGAISSQWLSLSGGQLSGKSSTLCTQDCLVGEESQKPVLLVKNHDLTLSGSTTFSSDYDLIVFDLESSYFKLSGTSKIHGHILIKDDSSVFQISGETEILSGGSLEVKKGELILQESNSIEGQLSILESGNAVFSGNFYTFESESLFILHSNSLELLDKDVVVTVKGSFKGLEFFNHTVGEFKFLENSKIQTDTIILHNSAVLNVDDTIVKVATSFQIFSGFVNFKFQKEVHSVSIPSFDLYNGELSITGGDFSFTEVFVHNSTTGTSVSFSDTSSLNIDHFTVINSNVQFSIDEDSDHVFDVFVFQETDFTSSSDKLQFNNLTLIDSKRLGSGNVSADWLSIHGSEFNGNSFTKCFGRCFVDNDYSNVISILGGHDLIFDGESLFSSYSVQVVFVLETSNFKLSGTSKIHGHILIDDDDSSFFQISGETQILSGGSLEVKKVINLTGVLTVTEGELILKESNSIQGQLSILELGNASESLFTLHSNSLELLDKNVVVTVKGSFTGVEFFNHTVGEFKFLENSKIQTDSIILYNSAVLNVDDTIVKMATSFQIFSGFVNFKCENKVHSVSIPSFDLYNGELSITGGHFSFTEVFVHNSTTGTSVSFSDTSSLNIDHFTAINSNVQFSIDENSDHVFDVFVFQETDFTSSSDKLQFNNLTLIDSKRLGSGDVSAGWLSIHGSEFNGNSFTKCSVRCFVDNEYSNTISILGGHDLIFDGESLFSSYSVQVVFVLESSNFKLSGTSKIHGHILIDDDHSSIFQISGETQILSGGSLEVKNVIALTGVLTVTEGELILEESNSIQGQLSILELGNAIFQEMTILLSLNLCLPFILILFNFLIRM
ncbi:hypothetical protein GEMRC1_004593 [Eukaryota sp. GEM-RC1]